jgi:SAM-dependent methyltransferase
MGNYQFYHCVELAPGIVTPGWEAAKNSQAPVMAEIQRIGDFSGKRVLDIGCRDGLFLYEMEKRGAASLLGIDNDLSIAAVEFIIPTLRSKVQMKSLNVYDLFIEAEERFDVVIFAGVLYHLRFPFLGLKRVADALRPGGEVIIESSIMVSYGDYPLLYCPAPKDSPYEPTSVTFFNHKAMVAALESFGFVDVRLAAIVYHNAPYPVFRSIEELATSDYAFVLKETYPIVCRGTWTARRAPDDDATAARDKYWYGTHNLHGDLQASVEFLKR